MIDGAEEYRVEPGSVRNAGAWSDEHLSVDGGRRSCRTRDAFMLKIASGNL